MSPQFVFYFQSSVVGQRRDVWLSHWEVKILKRRIVGYFLILIHDHNHHIQSNSIVICLNLEKNRFLAPPPHPFLLLFFCSIFFIYTKLTEREVLKSLMEQLMINTGESDLEVQYKIASCYNEFSMLATRKRYFFSGRWAITSSWSFQDSRNM